MPNQSLFADIGGVIYFLLGISALYGIKEILGGMFGGQPGLRETTKASSTALPPPKSAAK